MFITVSGPPGSGKSTTAAALAEHFGLEHTSGGDIFRGLAEEKGISLGELNRRAEEDPAIDRDLDHRLQEVATDADDLVLESRLAGWLSGDHADFRIWLDAPVAVRAERIADREDKSVEVAREETVEREASEAQRYLEYYDVDISDLSIYDVALNTARWGEEDVPELLASMIERHDEPADEGKVPVGFDL
jgi:cytidylate kinase